MRCNLQKQQHQQRRRAANRSRIGLIAHLFLAMNAFGDEQFLAPEELELLQPVVGVEGLMRHQVGDKAPADFDRLLIGRTGVKGVEPSF